MKLSEHFDTSEFRCPCGSCNYSTDDGVDKFISRNLILLLEAIRAYANQPLFVTSGLRCPARNKAVGGEDNSAHLRGEAADLRVLSSADRYELVIAALTKGCRRIGVYKNDRIIHVDVATIGVPQDVMWVR